MCFLLFLSQADLSFEADAETLSLFTSLDYELDDDDACQKIRAVDEIVVAGNKETADQQADNSDERTDEDEEEEEDEEEDDEETAASLVHSVEPATGKFFFYFGLKITRSSEEGLLSRFRSKCPFRPKIRPWCVWKHIIPDIFLFGKRYGLSQSWVFSSKYCITDTYPGLKNI